MKIKNVWNHHPEMPPVLVWRMLCSNLSEFGKTRPSSETNFDPTLRAGAAIAIAAMVFLCTFGRVPNFEITACFRQSQKPMRCFVRFPRKIGVKPPEVVGNLVFLRGEHNYHHTTNFTIYNSHLYLPIFRLAWGMTSFVPKKKTSSHMKGSK